MKLTPYKKEDLRGIPGKQGYLHEILDEFANSGKDCAKIEGYIHKNGASCTSSLNVAIKRYNKHGIKAVTVKGEPYLIRIGD